MIIPPSYVRGRMVGIGAIVALILGILVFLVVRYGLTGEWEQLWQSIGITTYQLTWALRSLIPL